jgi:glycine cleavage system H protein
MSRYYTKTHEWVDFYPDRKVARIGISDFAQQQLGEIIHVEFSSVGKKFAQGDSVCIIESVKIASDVYTPVAGKITELNIELESQPSLLNDDAEKTWILEITYNSEPSGLLSPQEYQRILQG